MKIAAEAMTAPQTNVGLVRMPPSMRLGLGLVGGSSSSCRCFRPPMTMKIDENNDHVIFIASERCMCGEEREVGDESYVVAEFNNNFYNSEILIS